MRVVTDEGWRTISEDLGLALDDPWETLGVEHGASLDEIKYAYRRKMNGYHPDRYGQGPSEFQELATKLTVNLQHAFERLKAMHAQA